MRRVLLALTLLACGEPVPETGVMEGSLAIPLQGKILDGEAWSLSAQQGRPTLVVFWASWCGPCMEEIPHLNALKKEYGDRLELVGVNMGESLSKIQQARAETEMSYATLLDKRGEIAGSWRVRKLPLMVVMDKEGRVRFRGIGSEEQLKVLLDSLVNA